MRLLGSIALCVAALFVSAAQAGEVPPLRQTNVRQVSHLEVDADSPPIIIKLRICEGDPSGSVEKGTLKVISSPAMITNGLRPARLQVGGELEVPGDDDARLDFGIIVDFTPQGIADGKIRAKIDCEVTEPMKDGNGEQVGVSGRVLRTSGLFTPGKTVKLTSSRDGKGSSTWVEVTLDIVNEKSTPVVSTAGTKDAAANQRAR
jgi:hypothetical protein